MRLLIVILLILLTATPLYANGWILWEKITETRFEKGIQSEVSEWTPNLAFPEYDFCTYALEISLNSTYAAAVKANKSGTASKTVKGSNFYWTTFESKNKNEQLVHTHYYYCYPGTFDPRRRK